ncbi:hypothetical protein M409DRAFT_26291 [Zasmidium cellare ATCC 36951]|uniref:Flavin reductase like domain-containing protein n=1 Tax=Zasmidium cellare ATCC 36951 TaxID=1080233 RepID=A0A6A6C7T7_ZASCE|nr:uncharacterized protein M409DRAFT_26291 [Zasmidium cellare ATCC 36951]KAF2163247.1 hypothetical protein M409DRAFT_26291 [Zasmidium cellare ATCC 36951]
MSHSEINPSILYWGTPVVLITTENEDGTYNIGPMSSACLRTKQCVLNLPSDDMTSAVNALARTTGTPEVPAGKIARGYRHVKDKFGAAGLTPETSAMVRPPRIKECPVQMEAELHVHHNILTHILDPEGGVPLALEVKVLKTYVVDELRLSGHTNRIDPDKWRPMIMMFQHLYGLKGGMLAESTLAGVEEELYRMPATKSSWAV